MYGVYYRYGIIFYNMPSRANADGKESGRIINLREMRLLPGRGVIAALEIDYRAGELNRTAIIQRLEKKSMGIAWMPLL